MAIKLSKIVMIFILLVSITSTYAYAESTIRLQPPHKQIASGTAAVDVICNSGLSLMLKLNSEASVCVKPSTAIKLQENGWGKILTESSMMEEQRMKIKEMQDQKLKEEQEKITQEKKIDEKISVEPIYDPKILPRNFVPQISNKFFTLTVGTTLVYESQLKDGVERTEFFVTGEKRLVMGVETTVVWDRVWLDEELIEDTKDWFAQDLQGNVWYFGEDPKEFEDGKLVRTEGSWEAGKDGARPGIIMKAVPQIGDSYRQEFYQGKAEDMAEISLLNDTVSVPYGKFSNCLKTKEWNPLESDSTEFKYYCAEIGGVVLETNLVGDERTELVGIKTAEKYTIQANQTDITVERAKEIALEAVPGIVTSVEIDTLNGSTVYVIEIAAKTGIETDVFIDKITGKILSIEG